MPRERHIKDYVTYNERSGRYTDVLNSLYRYYEETEPIGFQTLVKEVSCGLRTEDDFKREDGKRDMKKIIEFSRQVIQLWNTNVSPEPYMTKYDTFEEAASAYANAAGIESAVDAHLSGVPIEDLLA